MLFIWRGLGFLVPVILFISGFAMSAWFENTRLGNYPFVGWTLFWAGVVLAVLGTILWGGGAKVNPKTGEIGSGRRHDFFWIPMLFWGLGLMFLGIWVMGKKPLAGYGEEQPSNQTEQIIEHELELEKESGERRLNVYNPSSDSVYVQIIEPLSNTEIFSFYVPARSTRYKEFPCKEYEISIDGNSSVIELKTLKYSKKGDYNEVWFVAGAAEDLVLVDVTGACSGDLTRRDIRAIDWGENVIKKYNSSGGLIEPKLVSSPRKQRIIYGLGEKLPIEHSDTEYIYALLSVKSTLYYSDQELESQIIALCFND